MDAAANGREAQMAKRILLIGFVAAYATLAIGSVLAEVPRKSPPPGDTLQAVLDRIRNHAANDAWKQPDWKDETIEAWLDKLVGSVAKAAELPDLKLPVRMADVTPGDPAQGFGFGIRRGGTLFIGKDFKLSSLAGAIVLADGSVNINSARNCVIVARGAVTTSSSHQCVIVSGAYVSISIFDGDRRSISGSLVATRGWADINSAHGTIIAALQGTDVNEHEGAVFVNAEVPPARARPLAAQPKVSRSVHVPDLPLEPLHNDPLAAKIEPLGVIHGKIPVLGAPAPRFRVEPTGLVFRFEGRRYVADLGKPIVDEGSQTVEALREWTLTYGGDRLAIFRKNDLDAVVRMEK
jgi:hypothetical protein